MDRQIESAPDRRTVLSALGVYAERPALVMVALGFSGSLPYFLIFDTLSAWFRAAGLSLEVIGFFSLVTLVSSFKFLWAPFIDRARVPMLHDWLGHRRSWMLVCQGLIMLGLWLVAVSDPARSLGTIAVFAVLVGFSSATQDIAIDAWRIETAETSKQGAMAAAYQWGYRAGMIVAGAVPLLLAQTYGWNFSYGVMGALMGVGVLAVLAAPREERHAIRPIQTEGLQPAPAREALEWIVRLALLLAGALVLGSGLAANAGIFARVLGAVGAPGAAKAVLAAWASPARVWVHLAAVVVGFGVIILAATPLPGARTRPGVYLLSALGDPLRDFFTRYRSAAGLILALICLYRIPDFVLNIMNPFYLDLGYTLVEIAEIRSFCRRPCGRAVWTSARHGDRGAGGTVEQSPVHLARDAAPQSLGPVRRDWPRQHRRWLRGHLPHRLHVEPHIGRVHRYSVRTLFIALCDSRAPARVAIGAHRRERRAFRR
jgi:PAT family beta-lactamase induction signal transducer AmpG